MLFLQRRPGDYHLLHLRVDLRLIRLLRIHELLQLDFLLFRLSQQVNDAQAMVVKALLDLLRLRVGKVDLLHHIRIFPPFFWRVLRVIHDVAVHARHARRHAGRVLDVSFSRGLAPSDRTKRHNSNNERCKFHFNLLSLKFLADL